MKHLIAPSILTTDFGKLGETIDLLNRSEADLIHLDIMDGVFVPNISFGFPVIEAISNRSEKPLDVHLMIVKPDRYIEEFAEKGAEIITVHYEACNHLHRTVALIKSFGIKAGVSINPHSPVSLLEDIISFTDLVLLMSVNPGFGGQRFIENTYEKVKQLKQLILTKNAKTLIEVDGGINLENAENLIVAGTDILVVGNSVFSAENPEIAIKEFKRLNFKKQY